MTSPRVLFLDIETAPAAGLFWGHTYQTDIIKVTRPQFVLSYAYQWVGEDKIQFRGLPYYPEYKANLENDFFLLKDLHKVMDEADVIIAHNGDRFDIRVIQGRFIRYHMAPPSPFRTIDTLRVCKRQFRIESNRLNFVADYLGIGQKLPHTGLDLWERCMQGQEQAWNTMEKYNKHDIYLLREVYNVIKPYVPNHPNLAQYQVPTIAPLLEEVPGCPVCMSRHTKKAGVYTRNARQYPQYKCDDCGKFFHDTKSRKTAQRPRTVTGEPFATVLRKGIDNQISVGQHFNLPFVYEIAKKIRIGTLTASDTGSVRCVLQRKRDDGQVKFLDDNGNFKRVA